MPQVIAGSAAYPPDGPDPIVTIGNFDGVHLGHQALLNRLVTEARAAAAPAVVYTFEPSPRAVLAPAQAMPRILAWPDKVRLLGEAGVDIVVVERFTRAFAQHPADWFATEILGHRLHAGTLVVGYDFRFGKARAGDVALLRKLLPALHVEQVEAERLGGQVVSSSVIRELVMQGDVDQARSLLGTCHFLRGTVVPGDQRGRQLGYPTANVETDAQLLPAHGVYAVRVRVDGGAHQDGVANLGMRPTFDGDRMLLEVHLLDGRPDLYGRELEVAFVARIRGEQRFADVDALVTQIRADVGRARTLLGAA